MAIPETTYAFLTSEGRLGHDWTLFHTGNRDLDLQAYRLLLAETVPKLLTTLHGRYDVEKTYLLGFSQGAIVALLAGLVSHDTVDGVVTFGLAAFDPAWFEKEELRSALEPDSGFPLLLVHGTEDERVPATVSRQAHRYLMEAGFEASLREFSGGHSVPDEQLEAVAHWLRSRDSSD